MSWDSIVLHVVKLVKDHQLKQFFCLKPAVARTRALISYRFKSGFVLRVWKLLHNVWTLLRQNSSQNSNYLDRTSGKLYKLYVIFYVWNFYIKIGARPIFGCSHEKNLLLFTCNFIFGLIWNSQQMTLASSIGDQFTPKNQQEPFGGIGV